MRRTLLFVMSSLLILAGTAGAAELKIGYVDLQKAINQSAKGQSAKEQISQKVQTYKGQVEQREQALQKAKEELEKQALLLSDEARTAKERDYQQQVKDYQRFAKDIQEELQQTDVELTRKILVEVLKVAEELGAKENFTVILEKNESSLVYVDPAIDLTERVVKLYNARQK